MKSIDELTFIDDYVFGAVLQDKEICRQLVELLLGIKVYDIQYPEVQKAIEAGYRAKGIRMDVYTEADGKPIDLELQNRNYSDLGLRMRYYQSMMDMDILQKGCNYNELKETYIIFICTSDPFKKNVPLYEFDSWCNGEPAWKLDDRNHRMVYNSAAYGKVKEPRLRDFLKFVASCEASDEFTQCLTQKVQDLRQNEFFLKEYMSMTLREHDVFNDGKAEGKAEGIQSAAINMIKSNSFTVEQIILATGLPKEEVEKLMLQEKES